MSLISYGIIITVEIYWTSKEIDYLKCWNTDNIRRPVRRPREIWFNGIDESERPELDSEEENVLK